MNLLLILAEDAEAKHWVLDPQHGLIVWTAISFGIVAMLLYRYAWGPILIALQEREAAIVGSIESAEAKKQEAEQVRLKYESQLENIRQDAHSIIEEGNADKERIIKDAHTKASKEAAEIRARADREIVLAKQKALAEIKDEARILSMAIAAKVIAAEVDAKKHKSIVDEVIASYERV